MALAYLRFYIVQFYDKMRENWFVYKCFPSFRLHCRPIPAEVLVLRGFSYFRLETYPSQIPVPSKLAS